MLVSAVGVAREKTSSLVELVTEIKEKMIKPVCHMRSKGMVHFHIAARIFIY